MCGAGNACGEPAPHGELSEYRGPHEEVAMTNSVSSAVPPQSRDPGSDRARSRNASALRLTILVVVTGLVVAFIAAGAFVGVLHQLTTASR